MQSGVLLPLSSPTGAGRLGDVSFFASVLERADPEHIE